MKFPQSSDDVKNEIITSVDSKSLTDLKTRQLQHKSRIS